MRSVGALALGSIPLPLLPFLIVFCSHARHALFSDDSTTSDSFMP